MKDNTSDITVVLDRSGSMDSIADDTIGGFNAFLKDQRAALSVARITLAQFDDAYEMVYSALDIEVAPFLTRHTFIPRGSTALLDAIGRTINETGVRLAAMPESERPSRVLFVILTDGFENASTHFNAAQVNAMIVHQRDVYKWQFIFLGANQDAITTASQIGIGEGQALTYAADRRGTRDAFKSASKYAHAYLSAPDEEMLVSFDLSDRAAQNRDK